MTAFYQINSHDAADFLAGAGITEARRYIVDFAAAGLLKTYAQKVETTPASGECIVSVGSTIPPMLWKRIVAEGVADDVWNGGTVRLAGSGLIGGVPAVAITGIGFSEKFIQRLVDQHRGGRNTNRVQPSAKSTIAVSTVVPIAATPQPLASRDHSIPVGALWVTSKQAEAALGLGRTTVDKLVKNGGLIRQHFGRSARIEVASIHALMAGRIPSAD